MTCPAAVTCWPGSPGSPGRRRGPAGRSRVHRAPAQRVRERDLPGAGPDEGRSILRVHRLGYHTAAEIESELAWMDALRAEAGVRTPRVLPGPGGGRVMTMADETGQERHCVRFEYLAGAEPADDEAAHFAELGEITARMHQHARQWRRPAWFTRFHWDYDAAFGARARWGRWQDGIGVGVPEHAVLGRLDGGSGTAGRVRHRPAALRAGPRRHQAGQPARGRRPGQRHRLRRLRASAGTSTTSAPR